MTLNLPHIVLDHDNHPVRVFADLPLTLSSELEGYIVEAVSRLDARESWSLLGILDLLTTYRDPASRYLGSNAASEKIQRPNGPFIRVERGWQ